jgi:predicted permease
MLGGVAWMWGVFVIAIAAAAIGVTAFGVQRPTAGAVLLASGAGSTAGFALPFVGRYCGEHCVAPAIVLSVLGGALAFSVLGVAASCVLSQGRVCGALIARRILSFPPLIALLIGLVAPRSTLPQFVQMAVHDLAATLTPVAIVALGIHLRRLPERRRLVPILAALSFRLILAPAAVLLGILLMGRELSSFAKLLVLLAAMPPLISSIAVARQYHLEADLSAQIAAFGASIALFTVPLWGTALEYLV